MQNNFAYSGKVSITLGKRRSTTYNKGTNHLFQYFANALIGDEEIHLSSPNRFVIIPYCADNRLDSNTNNHRIITIQRKTLAGGGITARLSGYLTNQLHASDINRYQIQLLFNTTLYATLDLDSEQISILSSVTDEKSALIEWELTVSNKS